MSEKSTRNSLVLVAESWMMLNRSAFLPQMRIKCSQESVHERYKSREKALK